VVAGPPHGPVVAVPGKVRRGRHAGPRWWRSSAGAWRAGPDSPASRWHLRAARAPAGVRAPGGCAPVPRSRDLWPAHRFVLCVSGWLRRLGGGHGVERAAERAGFWPGPGWRHPGGILAGGQAGGRGAERVGGRESRRVDQQAARGGGRSTAAVPTRSRRRPLPRRRPVGAGGRAGRCGWPAVLPAWRRCGGRSRDPGAGRRPGVAGRHQASWRQTSAIPRPHEAIWPAGR
jgi:hypothetical protein